MKVVCLVLVLTLTGCAAQKIHPGTASAFDSDVFDVLSETDNVIQSAKSMLAVNKFPAAYVPTIKTALNALIAVYNQADVLYCGQPLGNPPVCSTGSYHAQAMAGTATQSLTTQMQSLLTSVQTGIATLGNAENGK